ncbi:MAG: 1-acyl-sn-glycerol-3-phosphate acyltransferase [Candidatus Tokpelaia sp. JSC085]|nr:MAG: 1-acyl-sn-glycerol-3-phosphate acyltransferase [Candidatus Tokpelaia sp. JSC085]
MLIIRSLLFKVSFLTITIIQMVLVAPIYFFLPHKLVWIIPRIWVRTVLWLEKYIAGTTYDIEGVEHLPKGACIIAAKHQSIWETLTLVLHINDPTFVLKRELMWLPGLGWFLAKVGMIPINRGTPLKALKRILKGARKMAMANRQIVIFPEGTRQPPGARPDYKSGIFPIYSELNLPVIPVALNSGLYWPKQYFHCYPGVIRCRILPAIKPGLEKREFMSRLEGMIEDACDALLIAAANDHTPPFMPPTSVNRLKELEMK